MKRDTKVDWPAVKMQAKYLGVYRYGEADVCHQNMDRFFYRFQISAKECLFTLPSGEPYTLQNCLRVGRSYELLCCGDRIIDLHMIGLPANVYSPPVSAEPGVRTIRNLLLTAMMPVGTTLYVFGGGWNWQDNGFDAAARRIGLSPEWRRFFLEQDASYTYKERDGAEENRNPAVSFYPYGGYNAYHYAGLDCSGFVGWTIFNTFGGEGLGEQPEGPSTLMAEKYALRGWGQLRKEGIIKPGDVVSIRGHVWISLGTCPDGSLVPRPRALDPKQEQGRPARGWCAGRCCG